TCALVLSFYVQAEDGIRDRNVTGVQTCALPIFEDPSAQMVQWFYHKSKYLPKGDESSWQNYIKSAARSATTKRTFFAMEKTFMEIGRASCRERAEGAVGAGSGYADGQG